MANLDHGAGEGVSLFPMFNILACTLGVMVFVLATVATVSLGSDKAVRLVAAESSHGLGLMDPSWMEWNGTALVSHPSGERVEFDQDLRGIPTFEQTYDYLFGRLAGTALGAELAEISADPDRYVILLVRPSGFRTLPEVRGYFSLLAIDLVEEPIDEDWRRIRVR